MPTFTLLEEKCNKCMLVEFNSEWVIKSATCNCPRRQLRCHHMAALILFARDNISVIKLKQVRDPEVKKLSDLYPPKDHRSTASLNINSVFDGSVGFSWLLSEESDQEENGASPTIVDIESLIFHEDYDNKLRYFEDHLKVDDEYVKHGSTNSWTTVKSEMASSVIGACKRQRFPPSLFKRLLGTYNMEHLKAIQWGSMHEKEGQLSITKLKNAHLVIWTPKEVVIVNIQAECFDEHLNVLKMFYFEHYISFLFGEKRVVGL
nr:unnamed protein product [Callosobruchus analis]